MYSSLPPTQSNSNSGTTQSNEGRSYEQYFHSSPAVRDGSPERMPDSLGREAQEGISQEPTFDEDNTGAVRFDFLAADQTPIDSRSGRRRQNEYRAEFTGTTTHLPETPVPQNPFGVAKKRGQSQIIPPSQLFAGTQVSSLARRVVSPTSSRPSPDDFQTNSISPNPIISSPTKARGKLSSYPDPTSSPHVLPVTTSQVVEGSTPLNPPGDTQPSRRSRSERAVPEPMGDYEPMRKSQEKRLASDRSSDQESDVEDSRARRLRRKAKSKKRTALDQLALINLPPSSKSDGVEVPSTEQKRKTKLEHDYLAQCHGVEGGQDSQDREMVADSQDQLLAVTHPELDYSSALGATRIENEAEEQVQDDDLPNTASPDSPILGDRDEPIDGEMSSREAIPETSPAQKSSRKLPEADHSVSRLASSNSSANSSAALRRSTRRSHQHDTDLNSSRPNQLEKTAQEMDLEFSALDPGSTAFTNTPCISTPKGAGQPTKHLQPQVPAVCAEPEPLEDQPPNVEIVGLQVPEADAPPASDLGNEVEGVCSELKAASSKVPMSNFKSSPPVIIQASRDGKAGTGDQENRTPKIALPQLDGHTGTNSTLSDLNSTPAFSTTSTTPATEERAPNGTGKITARAPAASSPARSRNSRRAAADPSPKLKTSTTESLRQSTRLLRHRSVSTDELARSPPSSCEPQSAAARLGRTIIRGQQSRDHSVRGRGLFFGMAFAVSLQSQRPKEIKDDYKRRMDLGKTVEKSIQDAGGIILKDGFDDLFEPVPVKVLDQGLASQTPTEVKLSKKASSYGFTALIADGHSRKVKYMQALALNVPCIAIQWVPACVAKNEILDWSPYLLCAGQSTVLGDAIRSRSLMPYAASSAQLAGIVEQRAQFFEGSRILLVMKKAAEKDHMPYVHLAQLLGASISRVFTMEEAREKMKTAEDAGQPFDWAYIDGKSDTEILYADSASFEPSRKRKRASVAPTGPPPKRIRSINNEYVIQSLIMGRLLEDTEMSILHP